MPSPLPKLYWLLPAFIPALLGGCASEPAARPSPAPAVANESAAPALTPPARPQAVHMTVLGDASYPGLLHDAALADELFAAEPVKLTLPPAQDVWERIRRGYGLPEDNKHPRTESELDWYARHQAYMDRVAERAQPYLYHIVEELESRGMPTEIALLPIVESAFHPFAYSHGRAAGLWQFIPGTGRHFGLEQNWWYDGRRDVYASTRAALDYLQRLHDRFDGDWLLALAAYNSGAGTVNHAIRVNKRRGKPTDFWSLDLPRETRGYVPKLLALAQLIGKPAAYGLHLDPIPNTPYFTRVEVDSQIDLALVAELADLDLDEVYRLNPGFNRWATAPNGPHYLLLPVDCAETFTAKLEEVPPDQRISWKVHKVRSGDSLGGIARQYHTTVATLRRVNRLHSNLIRAGSKLLIPVASRKASSYALSAEQRRRRTQDRERSGEKIVHVVRSGDTFWDLAQRHGVSVRQLASWNSMAPHDPLRPGQRLVIWTHKTSYTTSPVLPQQRRVTKRVGYVVRRGDSLYRISSRFKVSIAKLREWNKLQRGQYLQPGQRLTLYVDVMRQSGS